MSQTREHMPRESSVSLSSWLVYLRVLRSRVEIELIGSHKKGYCELGTVIISVPPRASTRFISRSTSMSSSRCSKTSMQSAFSKVPAPKGRCVVSAKIYVTFPRAAKGKSRHPTLENVTNWENSEHPELLCCSV